MATHLLLMRHAKSSWKDSSLSDHARPLNKRGKREADAVAQHLTAMGVAPDVIWASDATRTQETATRVIRIIPGAQTIIKVPEFYHASAATVLDLYAKSEEPEGRIMLLGHNPGWNKLAEIMSNSPISMPTANCLIFKRTSNTSENWLSPENWTLNAELRAKTLLADSEGAGQE